MQLRPTIFGTIGQELSAANQLAQPLSTDVLACFRSRIFAIAAPIVRLRSCSSSQTGDWFLETVHVLGHQASPVPLRLRQEAEWSNAGVDFSLML